MKKFNRRQFIRWLGIQLAALGLVDVLAACEGRMVEMPPIRMTPGSDVSKATNTLPPGATASETGASPIGETGAPVVESQATSHPSSTATNVPPTSTQAPPPTATSPQPTATHTARPAPTATHTARPAPTATHTARPAPTATHTGAPPAGTATATSPPAPTSTPLPTATRTPVRSGNSYMAVARRGDPVPLVQAAMQSIGGMGRFVSPGDDVIIKPNICINYRTYEYAATTNPWVVGELVTQAFAAGAGRVRVLDYPFGGSSDSAYTYSGIRAQVVAAGGEMESISMFKFVNTSIPQGIDLTSCDIYEDIISADVVINVPIAKHHSLAGLTMAMKNLMGVIRDRPTCTRSIT